MHRAWLLLLVACDKVLGLSPNPVDATAIDASPDARLAMHDEDGDGVDDNIDLCPTFADPTQLDEDRDGVGNACDPHPNDAIDKRVYFSPLLELRAAEWLQVSGTWVNDVDSVRQTSTDLGGNYVAALQTMHLNNPTIEVVIDQVASPYVSDAGVMLEVDNGPTSGGCYYQLLTDRLVYFDNRSGEGMEVPGPITTPEGRLRLTMQAASIGRNEPRCVARWGMRPPEVVDAIGYAPLANVKVQLYTYQAAATYHSIIVFDTQ